MQIPCQKSEEPSEPELASEEVKKTTESTNGKNKTKKLQGKPERYTRIG